MPSKKIGVSFLGGGMRAVAYVGMLKAFEENDIEVESLIGTSGGALVAAAYAGGKTPDEIFEHFLKYNLYRVANPFRMIRNRGGMYAAWRDFISDLVPNELEFKNTKRKLAIHVANIDKRESEYLADGSVLDAVVGSCAFLFPFKIGTSRYIDGDYDPETGNNVLKAMGSDYTILCYTKFNTVPWILPLFITQKNAIELDMRLHRVNKVFRIMLDNGSLLGKSPIRENFYHGYLQAVEFIKENRDKLFN